MRCSVADAHHFPTHRDTGLLLYNLRLLPARISPASVAGLAACSSGCVLCTHRWLDMYGFLARTPHRAMMSSRISFFEVEILDCRTKQQLCFLDKVFLLESTGPLFVYFLFYFRMPFFYGLAKAFTSSPHSVVHLACCCHSFHYIKRLIETIFVHRFSHGTMPLKSIVKIVLQNCFYYWGFAAWLAYYINHPLYTPPIYGKMQISLSMVMFLMCETGNFSIHVALSNLRLDGSRSRRFPFPTRNPFTWLFFFVSCPNYTYEVGSWISLTVMTQCFPVGLFTLIGFIQMTIWAREKHYRYIKDFKDYPRLRMSIIPLLL
ncbi:very-long-chain enoyl-CoA reductase-like isoform X3 [Pseudophryne corroboree]|uniref:very-long-chain enoyl-CoA reductase-like isoform X3 n=1 Tax=Pseudophryne corroboree TaxID=495146 RepID=UPI003081A2F7